MKRKKSPIKLSSWCWTEEEVLKSDANIDKFVTTCENNKMMEMFISVNDALFNNEEQIIRLPYLVGQLNKKGIVTSALISSDNWFYPEKRYKLESRLDKIITLNHSLPYDSKLFGVHMDIEPEAQDVWSASNDTERVYWLELLADTYESVYNKINSERLSSEVDLSPFFYKYNRESCEKIINNCDLLTLMAYGKPDVDDLIEYCSGLVGISSSNHKTFDIGIRVNDFSTYNSMIAAIDDLTQFYSKRPYFRYVAIHHIDSFVSLRNKTAL